MRDSDLRLLIVYAEYTDRLSYYDDWLDAFKAWPGFRADGFNIVPANSEAALRAKLAESDAVVILHSATGDTTIYLERYAKILGERKIPLLSFVGNEVNLPGSPIAEKRRVLGLIRPDWIATQLLEDAGRMLFGDLAGQGVVSIPHALNPAVFSAKKDSADRPIDIGTRAARYLPHLGDNDRNRIIERFRIAGAERGLSIDISDTRFSRDDWAAFLNRCKGTIATEAGSWFIERDDTTVDAIRADIRSATKGIMIANDSSLRSLGHKLPWWIRRGLRSVLGLGLVQHEALVNEHASYDAVYQKYFAGRVHPEINGKCISSRHFDAIGTRTCQIMFRGRFNDILEADRHYIALNDDFSNFDAVVERFRDDNQRNRICEEAYAHVLEHHTYDCRMRQIADIFSQCAA
ncbi:MAG: glycosyltransferase [Pseudolabrys sp.]|nr:glycosyltransferase [Pseudolabrys sp.]